MRSAPFRTGSRAAERRSRRRSPGSRSSTCSDRRSSRSARSRAHRPLGDATPRRNPRSRARRPAGRSRRRAGRAARCAAGVGARRRVCRDAKPRGNPFLVEMDEPVAAPSSTPVVGREYKAYAPLSTAVGRTDCCGLATYGVSASRAEHRRLLLTGIGRSRLDRVPGHRRVGVGDCLHALVRHREAHAVHPADDGDAARVREECALERRDVLNSHRRAPRRNAQRG